MENIPLIKRAVLVDQMALKLDADMGQEVRMLKAEYKVDVQEIIRAYLRKELPKLRKKLSSPA